MRFTGKLVSSWFTFALSHEKHLVLRSFNSPILLSFPPNQKCLRLWTHLNLGRGWHCHFEALSNLTNKQRAMLSTPCKTKQCRAVDLAVHLENWRLNFACGSKSIRAIRAEMNSWINRLAPLCRSGTPSWTQRCVWNQPRTHYSILVEIWEDSTVRQFSHTIQTKSRLNI